MTFERPINFMSRRSAWGRTVLAALLGVAAWVSALAVTAGAARAQSLIFDDEIEPPLQEQLTAWCTKFPVQLPLGVMQVFLSCWIRLYGLVCMEIFGHLKFALDDAEPMFEAELHGLAEVLNVADAYAELERA